MSQKNIQGDLNVVGNYKKNGVIFSPTNYDGIRFKFNLDNNNYTLDTQSNFASYVRISDDVLIFIASFYITKDTIGTGSNPIIIGSFRHIPNELWDKIVAGASGYVDEQDTKAFVDGSFNSVGAKMALIKNDNDDTLDLLLETTNMENNVEYHIRYESVLLLSNNIASAPKIVIENLGSENPLNVTFGEGVDFPTGNDLCEEVTVNGNVFIKFPTFYKKSVADTNGKLIGYSISKEKIDEDYVPYDCFLDESGNVLPYVLIGKYNMSSSTVANSVNNTPITMTPSTARTNARALGTGYQLIDCAMYCFIRDLAFAIHKRFVLNDVTSLFGLEHLGNATHLDGFSGDTTSSLLYSNKPSQYVDEPTTSTTGYVALSYGWTGISLNHNIKSVGCDPQHPTVCMPFERGDNKVYETYYCAPMSYSRNKFANFTMLPYLFSANLLNNSTNRQQRLCYRPISQ